MEEDKKKKLERGKGIKRRKEKKQKSRGERDNAKEDAKTQRKNKAITKDQTEGNAR